MCNHGQVLSFESHVLFRLHPRPASFHHQRSASSRLMGCCLKHAKRLLSTPFRFRSGPTPVAAWPPPSHMSNDESFQVVQRLGHMSRSACVQWPCAAGKSAWGDRLVKASRRYGYLVAVLQTTKTNTAPVVSHVYKLLDFFLCSETDGDPCRPFSLNSTQCSRVPRVCFNL